MGKALDRDKSGISNPLLQIRFAMRTKRNNTEAVNYLLSVCSVEALNFTIRSFTLGKRHDDIFKAPGLVLSRCESTGF